MPPDSPVRLAGRVNRTRTELLCNDKALRRRGDHFLTGFGALQSAFI